MPIIQPPPTPPKKETIAVRLDVRMLDELRRYTAAAGTKNYSHIIAGALQLLFDDTDYKAWLKAHPDFHPDTKPRRRGSAPTRHDASRSIPTSAGPALAGERQIGSRNTIGGA